MAAEDLTPEEVERAGIGSDMTYLRAARDKLKDDVLKLANERLGLERETKALLPTKFIQAYQGLMEMSLGVGKDYKLDPDSPGMLGVKDGTRGFSSGDGGLRDDAAAGYRRNVDRQLRSLARKMNSWMGADRRERLQLSVPIRCVRCSKFCEQEWKHCAWCGESLNAGSGSKEEGGA